MKTAGVLLAAGASRRFGAADKLLAPLNGRPLISYAARALVAAKPDVLIAISRNADVDTMLAGFDIMKPPENDPKQSDSLRAGIARAQALGAWR
ncbi:MAG: NTP transferase domain-containing protein, partial [Pseudomonadota bacterium]